MTVELDSKHASDDVDDSIVAGGEGGNDSFPPSDQDERTTERYWPKGWQQPVLGSVRHHSFDQWWSDRGQPYEAAVLAGGGVPWPQDPDKRKAVAEALSVPEGTDDMELRRALWERRHNKEIRA